MPIVNSNQWEVLVHVGPTPPAANAENTTFKTIGHCTSVSFSSSVSNITTTSKASLSQTQRISGQKDSSGSASGFTDLAQTPQPAFGETVSTAGTDNVETLFGYIQSGVTLYLRIGIGNTRITVPALASNLTTDGGTDDAPTYGFDWEQAGTPVFDLDVTA